MIDSWDWLRIGRVRVWVEPRCHGGVYIQSQSWTVIGSLLLCCQGPTLIKRTLSRCSSERTSVATTTQTKTKATSQEPPPSTWPPPPRYRHADGACSFLLIERKWRTGVLCDITGGYGYRSVESGRLTLIKQKLCSSVSRWSSSSTEKSTKPKLLTEPWADHKVALHTHLNRVQCGDWLICFTSTNHNAP